MFKVKHAIQSKPRTCGQTCIAMLTGFSEETIIDLIGHSHGTKTKEVIDVLNKLNIENSGKLLRLCSKRGLPDVGIIKCVNRGILRRSGWHWILKYKEKFYDPECEDMSAIGNYRIVSFIGIYRHA